MKRKRTLVIISAWDYNIYGKHLVEDIEAGMDSAHLYYGKAICVEKLQVVYLIEEYKQLIGYDGSEEYYREMIDDFISIFEGISWVKSVDEIPLY